MKSLCTRLGCIKTRTAPYHPESDGMIECFNRTCLMMLSMFVNYRRDNWHELLPFVMHAYRPSVHESTGYSSFRLMMGVECSLPHVVSTAELRTTVKTTLHHTHSLPGFETHWRSPTTMCVVPFRGLQPVENDYATLRWSIGSFRLVLGYYAIAHRSLNINWVPHGLDPTKSFDRPPVIPSLSKGTRKNLSCLFIVDDLKLCPGPQDISWVPNAPTAKSLCASTVAFRPDSRVSDITPDPSVDVSAWGSENGLPNSSTVLKNLDQPIDLTGHVLSPFYQRNIMYQDCKFHSIAHLMCCRYAIANGQKTFATGIRKWSRHLSDFPTPKFMTPDCIQQWLSILTDIYTHLCVTDTAFKSALLDTGPHPFTLQCLSPWGSVPSDPGTCPGTDLVSDALINVRVLACSDRLAAKRWLSVHQHSRPLVDHVKRRCFR